MLKTGLPLAGGLLAAIGASLCCAGPLVLLTLGISGSWISNLTLLEPYQPLLALTVFVLFAYAGWLLFKPTTHYKPDTVCVRPKTQRRRKRLY